MNERSLPLHQTVLDLQTTGENTLNDWFSIGNSVSTIRICLEDPQHNALAAALIVLDCYLTLADGDTARVDERLLAEGGVDVDGRDGATSAEQLCIPRMPRGAQTAMAAAKTNPGVSAAARLSLNGDAAVMLVGVRASSGPRPADRVGRARPNTERSGHRPGRADGTVGSAALRRRRSDRYRRC